MSWTDAPHAGEAFKKRTKGKQETRRVVDRQWGGGVVYVSGRMPNVLMDYHTTICSEAEWAEWAKDAKTLSE